MSIISPADIENASEEVTETMEFDAEAGNPVAIPL